MTLIERLRCEAMEEHSSSCIAEAAAELEANAAEIGRLREALHTARQFITIQAPAAAFPDMLAIIDAALNKQESGND